MVPREAKVEDSPQKKVDDVEDKMSVVVGTYAVMYPRTVVIMFCNTTTTTLAMFASNGLPNHTQHAEVLIVEFPQAY